MAVPSTFADLSTTPGSNSGLVSDSTAVNQIDNHLQSVYALIASIYANSGNGWASPYLTTASPTFTGTMTGASVRLSNASTLSWRNSGGTYRPVLQMFTDDNVYLDAEDGAAIFRTLGSTRMRIDASGLTVTNTSSPPSTPSGGGVLYVEAGALKYIGSSGTVTTLAPA